MIRAAREAGFVNNEALANELAARFYQATGRAKLARFYRGEARFFYVQWGAHAKAEALEKIESSGLLSPVFERRPSVPRDNDIASSLDWETVVKAAQAISSEIDLGRLLEKLLRFALQNAGATRGILVLERDGELWVQGGAALDQQEVRNLAIAAQPLAHSDQLAVSVAHYVARSRNNVVLADAAAEGFFIGDPFIAAHGSKSVLCAPILGQQKLEGLIYLENHLAPGAFTPARLEIIQVLAAQAAISLENARLYRQLEEYSHTLEGRVAPTNWRTKINS